MMPYQYKVFTTSSFCSIKSWKEGYIYNIFKIHNFGVLDATYILHSHVISLKSILLPPQEETFLYIQLLYLAFRMRYFC